MYKLGLIGRSVEHSKSPEIHHKLLAENGLEGEYHLFSIDESMIAETLEYFKTNEYTGFNVTVPYKETIIPYLDALETSAEVMQSVNTVKIVDGQLIGYNTDGLGYIESLKQNYPDWFNNRQEKTVLVLGAGGAAKGITHQLVNHQLGRIFIANRTQSKALELASIFPEVETIQWSEVTHALTQVDLAINTTTVGMAPNDHQSIISLKGLKSNPIVSDIVYQPTWTKLLIEAHEEGCPLLFGESMLYYQAVKAFEIWTMKE
ncbi:shikimate dehydrogenase [Alkalibacillus almallahensis]|uniref:shikimate dehydrogenase n=1 Tax=Alkalibacillus almallahensis TaxID=1379154 RepID=UPI0014212B83|nr:shikimate dehydrogenase [Alkalibacillus almallahensis]NIK11305.1 shikimate dehydrogenase [Alkalibacillus almallahensis]